MQENKAQNSTRWRQVVSDHRRMSMAAGGVYVCDLRSNGKDSIDQESKKDQCLWGVVWAGIPRPSSNMNCHFGNIMYS